MLFTALDPHIRRMVFSIKDTSIGPAALKAKVMVKVHCSCLGWHPRSKWMDSTPESRLSVRNSTHFSFVFASPRALWLPRMPEQCPRNSLLESADWQGSAQLRSAHLGAQLLPHNWVWGWDAAVWLFAEHVVFLCDHRMQQGVVRTIQFTPPWLQVYRELQGAGTLFCVAADVPKDV